MDRDIFEFEKCKAKTSSGNDAGNASYISSTLEFSCLDDIGHDKLSSVTVIVENSRRQAIDCNDEIGKGDDQLSEIFCGTSRAHSLANVENRFNTLVVSDEQPTVSESLTYCRKCVDISQPTDSKSLANSRKYLDTSQPTDSESLAYYRKCVGTSSRRCKRRPNVTSDPGSCQRDDFTMPCLIRNVIDSMISRFRIREKDVTMAMTSIKFEIKTAQKREFRKFPGLNFNDPAYCCAYLRRYAACHAGLVKEAVWNFLQDSSRKAEELKLNFFSRQLFNIMSLGGGPGNDVIGFLSALYEAHLVPSTMHVTIVDKSKGWSCFFPALLEAACKEDFGSITEFLKKVRFTTNFLRSDLVDVKETGEALKQALGEVDVILMVKLMSFLPKKDGVPVLRNIVKFMKPGSALVFLDTPFPRKAFNKFKRKIELIYSKPNFNYKFRFNPAKYHFPCIKQCEGSLHIYRRRNYYSEK